jgi:hypothetical protein
LEARAILVIGYGFGDEHINKMLAQAVRHDPTKRLVVVGNVRDREKAQQRQKEISMKLDIPSQTVVMLEGTAKEFLSRNDLASELSVHLPEGTKAEF